MTFFVECFVFTPFPERLVAANDLQFKLTRRQKRKEEKVHLTAGWYKSRLQTDPMRQEELQLDSEASAVSPQEMPFCLNFLPSIKDQH